MLQTGFRMLPAALLAASALISGPAFAETAKAPEAAATARAVDPAALAVARDIIAKAYPEAGRAALFGTAVDSISSQVDALHAGELASHPEVRTIVERHVAPLKAQLKSVIEGHIPALMDAIAVAYAREFPIGELQEVRAFVSTPTGQRFFARSVTIVSDPDIAAANAAMMKDAAALVEPMRKALTADLIEYFADHPEAAKSLAGQD